MKLYHRTSFWGKDLHGYKARGHKFPIIQVQAVIGDENGVPSQGCCPHHGKRLVVIDESHFVANEPNQHWNLYHVKTILGETSEGGDYYHDFCLMPQDKCLNKKNLGKGWVLLGTVRSSAARIDLAPMLRPFLINNQNFEYTYAKHHAHIALVMQKVTIQERTPASNGTKQTNAVHKKQKQQLQTLATNDRWQNAQPGMPFYQQDKNATPPAHQTEALVAIDSKNATKETLGLDENSNIMTSN